MFQLLWDTLDFQTNCPSIPSAYITYTHHDTYFSPDKVLSGTSSRSVVTHNAVENQIKQGLKSTKNFVFFTLNAVDLVHMHLF